MSEEAQEIAGVSWRIESQNDNIIETYIRKNEWPLLRVCLMKVVGVKVMGELNSWSNSNKHTFKMTLQTIKIRVFYVYFSF